MSFQSNSSKLTLYKYNYAIRHRSLAWETGMHSKPLSAYYAYTIILYHGFLYNIVNS